MTQKANANASLKQDEQVPLENVSLQSFGTYMLFKPVSDETSLGLCEFIIKSNLVFNADQVLTIIINSPGGSVYDGFGIIDLMESSRLKISTVAIGAVASMASLIFTAGEKGMRTMSKNAYIMTHQFYGLNEGRYHEFVASRSHEDDLHRRFIQHFVQHTKMTEKQVADILLGPSDKWITAKEALKLGMCDRVQDPWG